MSAQEILRHTGRRPWFEIVCQTQPKWLRRLSLAVGGTGMSRLFLGAIGALAAVAAANKASAAQTAFDPARPEAAGYRLVLDEEFNYSDAAFIDFTGHDASKLWHSGLWYQEGSIPSEAFYQVANGLLTVKDSGEAGIGTNLCTTTAQQPTQPGRVFRGGYFETRLLTHNWGGAGLYSVAWQRGDIEAVRSYSGAAELDILETDEAYPNIAMTTEHSDSLGAKKGFGADRTNRNNVNVIADPPMEGKWHTVGVLWTKRMITWYVDRKIVATARAFPQLWQPMSLCLWASPGGATGKGSTLQPAEVKYDWVHVWQLPGSSDAAGEPPTPPPITGRDARKPLSPHRPGE